MDARARALMESIAKAFSTASKTVGGNGVTVKQKVRDDTIIAQLEALAKKDVLVGIPADEAPRVDLSAGELNNAARLYIQEFGAPEANIPARPTVMPGIKNARDDVTKWLGQCAKQAMLGNPGKVTLNMHRAGLVAADAIKAMINSNVPPPLSEKTLQERRHRGVTRTNTLIDIGEMRNAVTYVLRDKT